MAIITSDLLRDIAVQCTEQFLNDRVPLSYGLAKVASEYGLNPDQVQRCVEATNTVAFLKIKGMSPDKTCEFPLAKYAEVMGRIVTPEPGTEKVHAQEDFDPFAGWFNPETTQVLTKAASEDTGPELSEAEALCYFTKMAAINEAKLESLQGDSQVILSQLLKLARDISTDPQGLDKMAQVCGDDYEPLSHLVTGSVQPKLDTGGVKLFTDGQTKQAQELVGLYKQAQEVSAEIKVRSSDLEKSAGFWGGVKATFRQPTGVIEKGVAGLTSAVTKPVRMAASLPVNAVKDAGRVLMNKGKSMSGLGTPKIKPLSLGSKLGLGGIAAGGVAMDAALYHPAAGKGVWDQLG